MKGRTNVTVPLCYNVSGPRRDHFKHEDEGFGPKMAKRLEDMLGRNPKRSATD